MHRDYMIVFKCDTCKIFGAYAQLDYITTSFVSNIGNRHSTQVTLSQKERIFQLFHPQLKTNLLIIWHHKLKLLFSVKYSWYQEIVIREEQCAKFESIPSIMAGDLQFDPFHQFNFFSRVTRWTPKVHTTARITGSQYGTKKRKYRCRRCALPHETWSECSSVEMCLD